MAASKTKLARRIGPKLRIQYLPEFYELIGAPKSDRRIIMIYPPPPKLPKGLKLPMGLKRVDMCN